MDCKGVTEQVDPARNIITTKQQTTWEELNILVISKKYQNKLLTKDK